MLGRTSVAFNRGPFGMNIWDVNCLIVDLKAHKSSDSKSKLCYCSIKITMILQSPSGILVVKPVKGLGR